MSAALCLGRQRWHKFHSQYGLGTIRWLVINVKVSEYRISRLCQPIHVSQPRPSTWIYKNNSEWYRARLAQEPRASLSSHSGAGAGSGEQGGLQSTTQNVLSRTASKSLSWVQSFESSPVAFGLITFDGFDEIIPVKAALPTRVQFLLQGTFVDYFHTAPITLAYRGTPRDAYVQVGSATLHGIRKALARDTILRAEVSVDRALNGHLTCWDPFTKSEASLTFNMQLQCSQSALIKNNHSK